MCVVCVCVCVCGERERERDGGEESSATCEASSLPRPLFPSSPLPLHTLHSVCTAAHTRLPHFFLYFTTATVLTAALHSWIFRGFFHTLFRSSSSSSSSSASLLPLRLGRTSQPPLLAPATRPCARVSPTQERHLLPPRSSPRAGRPAAPCRSLLSSLHCSPSSARGEHCVRPLLVSITHRGGRRPARRRRRARSCGCSRPC